MNRLAHGNEGDGSFCSFHPREVVVGVCAHCLKDRLLLLLLSASSRDAAGGPPAPPPRRRTSSISLPKVFALGSSFLLQRLDSRHHHQRRHSDEQEAYSDDDTASVASLDDSFISIKFEDNGKATWEDKQQKPENNKGAAAAAAAAPVRSSSSSSTAAVVAVVDNVKRGGVTRWRKQVVGRLLQLARWKRSAAKAGGAAVVGMDVKKTARGRGWIRNLTRRRGAAAHGDRAWS